MRIRSRSALPGRGFEQRLAKPAGPCSLLRRMTVFQEHFQFEWRSSSNPPVAAKCGLYFHWTILRAVAARPERHNSTGLPEPIRHIPAAVADFLRLLPTSGARSERCPTGTSGAARTSDVRTVVVGKTMSPSTLDR